MSDTIAELVTDTALVVPTYNTLEFLKIFLKSWSVFASGYNLVVIVDGSTDGTKEYLSSLSSIKNLHCISFDENKTQPFAYNEGIKYSKNVLKAKYVAFFNDDMVLGPGWDADVHKHLSYLDDGNHLVLNLAGPQPSGMSAVSFFGAGCCPSDFDFEKWVQFATDSSTLEIKVYEETTGQLFPFVVSSHLLDTHIFDYIYTKGGCLDTDFRFSLWLSGSERRFLNKNLLYHFSQGATNKLKESESWVNHSDTFYGKWGVGVQQAHRILDGIETIETSFLRALQELNKHFLSRNELL